MADIPVSDIDEAGEYVAYQMANMFTDRGLSVAWATMVFGAFGGYMLTGVPNKVLLLWETWPFQFITCLITFWIDGMASGASWQLIVADAVLVSVLIQLFTRITQKMEGTVYEKSDTFPLYDALQTRYNPERPIYHISSENYEGYEDEEECDGC